MVRVTTRYKRILTPVHLLYKRINELTYYVTSPLERVFS